MVYARVTQNDGYLSDPFIMQLAMRKFEYTEAELEAKVGRYVRGKRKGLLKGRLLWEKAVHGGWVKMGGYMHGFVAYPGDTWNYRIVDAWTGHDIDKARHFYPVRNHNHAEAAPAQAPAAEFVITLSLWEEVYLSQIELGWIWVKQEDGKVVCEYEKKEG